MAKKKATTKKRAVPPPSRVESVRIRMTPEFKAWLAEFAAARQCTAADVVTHSLMALAKAEAYEPPPRR